MVRKKRVVHFTSSLQRGGAEAILSSLVEDMRDQFEHTVLYVHDGPHRNRIEQLGVPCIPVHGAVGRYDPLFVYRAYRLIRALQPDLIHTLLWSATVTGRIIGRILKIPVVSVYHGNLDQNGSIRNFFDRITMPLSTQNCAVSSGVADSITQLSPGTSTSIIHNGIDCGQQPQKKNRSDIGCTPKHFVIGAVGRLVAIKRFDILIDAFARLHAQNTYMRLCLIGAGPELPALQAQARRLGIAGRITFLVDVSAIEYYHLFDCFVLPSPREGISIALLEAMRAALPVVVISDKVHPVVVDGSNGFIIPTPDAEFLANMIMRIHSDAVYAQQLGCAAYETVTTSFNRKIMVQQYTQMFRSAISMQCTEDDQD